MRKILFILSCLGLAAPAAQAQAFVFVPEGSSITCTLEEGCQEAGYEYGGLGFDLRGQIEAQPTLLEAARGMMVERAETALETIRGLSPLQLLSEEVARAAIRDRRWDSFRGISCGAGGGVQHPPV